jgi:hypothetical protein
MVLIMNILASVPELQAVYFGHVIQVGSGEKRGLVASALLYKLTHQVRVPIDVVMRLTGTYPSPRDQNILEAWIPIGQTSVEWF